MNEFSLALGGGGTRGAAHIGVLRVLARHPYAIRAIAGTSIGSIIGAFYASGYEPEEIEKIFATLDQSKLFGWPLSEGAGLLGIRGLADFLRTHFGERTFEHLRLPFAAVAVDLNSNCEVFLTKGRLLDALLASSAIPGLFPPREMSPYQFIDGGVLDPVPVRAARLLAPGLPVVAVSLMAPLAAPVIPLSLPVPRSLAETLTRLNITRALKIFADALEIGQRQMAELRLSLDRPEALLLPPVNDINILDVINVSEVARRGEQTALAALPSLRRVFSWPQRLLRWRNRPAS